MNSVNVANVANVNADAIGTQTQNVGLGRSSLEGPGARLYGSGSAPGSDSASGRLSNGVGGLPGSGSLGRSVSNDVVGVGDRDSGGVPNGVPPPPGFSAPTRSPSDSGPGSRGRPYAPSGHVTSGSGPPPGLYGSGQMPAYRTSVAATPPGMNDVRDAPPRLMQSASAPMPTGGWLESGVRAPDLKTRWSFEQFTSAVDQGLSSFERSTSLPATRSRGQSRYSFAEEGADEDEDLNDFDQVWTTGASFSFTTQAMNTREQTQGGVGYPNTHNSSRLPQSQSHPSLPVSSHPQFSSAHHHGSAINNFSSLSHNTSHASRPHSQLSYT